MFMRKIIVFLLVFVLIAASLAGCAKKDDTGQTNEPQATEDSIVTEETSLTFVFAGGDPLAKSLLEERIDAFNAANPMITIIAQPSSSGGYLDFIKTKDAVGEFPDMLECRDVQVWVEKLAELPDDIVAMLDNPATYEGKNYVAPMANQLTSLGCYYNKALFDDLGLTEPTTYAEFLTLCKTIKDSGTAPIVLGGKDIWHMGFWWGNYWIKNVYSEDPDWIAARYNDEVSFQDDNVQLTFQQYADLFEYVEKGWVSTGDNQLASFLVTEKAAMFFSGSWMVNQVAEADPDFELGWFPVPDVDGELRMYGGANLAGLAMSVDAAKDANKVAAFTAFCEYFYSDEVYPDYCASISFGPAIKNPPEIDYPSPLIQEFADAGSKAVFLDLNWNNKWGDNLLPGAFRNFAYKAFQDMLVNGTSTMDLGKVLDDQWAIEVELLGE